MSPIVGCVCIMSAIVGCVCIMSNSCIYVLYYMFYYISSLCSGGFVVCDCRHALVRCVRGARQWCASAAAGSVLMLLHHL
jgi:hypothetical protein